MTEKELDKLRTMTLAQVQDHIYSELFTAGKFLYDYQEAGLLVNAGEVLGMACNVASAYVEKNWVKK